MPIDMSLAAKAPPRKATAGNSSRTASRVPQQAETRSKNEQRVEGLLGLAQLGQGLCMMFGLYADAGAIGQHFPPLAKELANVADGSDIIAKPIDIMIEIGPYGALIATGMPFVMQIMANHKMLNASMLGGQGVVPPEVLEAQMRSQMAQMQAVALRKQQDAMQAAQDAQEEINRMIAEQRERQMA